MAFYEHIAVLPNNQVKCTLCDYIVENGELLEVHLHDQKHKESYMRNLMVTNSIIISTPVLFCFICNNKIDISDLTKHVLTKDHQHKLSSVREIIARDGEFIELQGSVASHTPHCTICDKNVEFTFDKLKIHISSDFHKRARSMVLQPLNGLFSVQGTDKYLWCKICQIFFDNYIELIFRHIEETDHAKKIGKLLRLIKGENIDIDKYLQDLQEDKACCHKCNIKVPCNVDNLQSHVKGKNHKSKK